MDSGYDELLDLEDEPVKQSEKPDNGYDDDEVCGSTPSQYGSKTTFDYVQWSSEPNGVFRACGPAKQELPPGVYNLNEDNRGIYFMQQKVITDDLIELDDAPSMRVLASIRKFWDSKERYVNRGYIYKRGIFLYGPAGGGKTALLMLLTQELVLRGGIVIMVNKPKIANEALQSLRRIESQRPLINIFEDMDELVNTYGEHDILAMLDGENQVDNVVNLATSNYPTRLGGRILNRPSRFDERIKIDMPNDRARERYLRHATRNETISNETLMQWVADTKDFSVAHIRELVIAVFCLEQPYEDVIERLRHMNVQPKDSKEFGTDGSLGFGQQGKTTKPQVHERW